MSKKTELIGLEYGDTDKIWYASRTIVISGDIDEDSLRLFAQKIEVLSRTSDPVRVLVTTFGGCPYTGVGFYDLFRYYSKKVKITTIGCGHVMSAGIQIYLGATDRKTLPNTRFMIHDMTASIEGVPEFLVSEGKELQRLKDVCKTIVVKNTKIKSKQYDGFMKGATYFSGEEAVELGIAKGLM